MDEPKAESVGDWLATYMSPCLLADRELRISEWFDGRRSNQRVVGHRPAADELTDLIIILADTAKPLHPSIQLQVAHALSPIGLSHLTICKRLRRRRGRPPKRRAGEARVIDGRHQPILAIPQRQAVENDLIDAMAEMDDQERNALEWLLDRNLIRRSTIVAERSGKRITIEEDLLNERGALINLLQAPTHPARSVPARDRVSLAALHPALRIAFAAALSKHGCLVIRNRPRPDEGRPRKRDAEEAYAIQSANVRVENARRILESKRPAAAVGVRRKPVSRKEAIAATNFGRTATYEDLKKLANSKRTHGCKPQNKKRD
jgi:hypothetical protein